MSFHVKSIALVAATAFAVLGGVGAAEAGGGKNFKKFNNNNFNNFNHGPKFRIVIGGGGNGCGYLYKKWQYTGSPYWKHQYYSCLYSY